MTTLSSEALIHVSALAIRGGAIRPSPISGTMVEYRGESGTIPAYLARPTDGGPRPAVVVIHELFGLVDHTKDVASRIAREGYVALAPNLFASRDLAAVLTPDARSEEHTSELQSRPHLV